MVGVAGTWNLTLTAADLNPPNTAGADFSSTYSSLVVGGGGPIIVTANGGGGPTWTVSLSKADVLWPAGVALIASLEPPVPGTVVLNNSPVTVTGVSAILYRDNTNGSPITIYYQLSGVSIVNLVATTYSTTVFFTVASP